MKYDNFIDLDNAKNDLIEFVLNWSKYDEESLLKKPVYEFYRIVDKCDIAMRKQEEAMKKIKGRK